MKKIEGKLPTKPKNAIQNEDKTEQTIREVIVEKKVGFNTLEVIIIAIIALIFGGILGFALSYTHRPLSNSFSSASELSEIEKVYNSILSNYHSDLNKEELTAAAIKGMLDSLNDPYSSYIDNSSTEEFDEQIYGYYIGIGADILANNDGTYTVTSVYPDSPCNQAGIEMGDIILKYNGKNVSDMTLEELSNEIRDKLDTTLILTIKHAEEIKELTLTRARIDLSSVYSNIIEKSDKRIGYINITSFASNTYSQFKEHLDNLNNENIDSLIIDVRNNLGGQLDSAKEIASLFLEKNKIIYQLNTKGLKEPIYSTGEKIFDKPVSIIINNGSASASEILTAALKESFGATVVGSNSYGKGMIQESYKLSTGSTIKYTIQEWLTPTGNSINGVGITPDIEQNSDMTYDGTVENDLQIQAAINDIIKK